MSIDILQKEHIRRAHYSVDSHHGDYQVGRMRSILMPSSPSLHQDYLCRSVNIACCTAYAIYPVTLSVVLDHLVTWFWLRSGVPWSTPPSQSHVFSLLIFNIIHGTTSPYRILSWRQWELCIAQSHLIKRDRRVCWLPICWNDHKCSSCRTSILITIGSGRVSLSEIANVLEWIISPSYLLFLLSHAFRLVWKISCSCKQTLIVSDIHP